MSDRTETESDPTPVKESDAERVTGADDERSRDPREEAAEIESDPAANPPEQALRDVKGG